MSNFFQQDEEGLEDITEQQLPTNIGGMVKWGLVVLGLILIFVLLNLLKSVYTDLLWFGELGFRSVYTKILVTRILLCIVGALVIAPFLGGSLYFANRFSKGDEVPSMPPEAYELVKKLVLWGTVAAVIILSVIFGVIAAGQWETFLRFANSTPFGLTDPVYGKDVSFFVFRLPMYDFIQGWLLGAAIVILLATVGIYFVNYSLRDVGFQLTTGLKVHVSVIAAMILLILALGHWLDRWGLLLSSDGAAFGAAYTDVHVRKVALLILTIFAVGAGILALVNAYLGGIRVLVGAVVLLIIMAIGLGAVWPSFVQRVNVTPNEFVREAPYIERNIDFTRKGYGIDEVTEVFYPADTSLTSDVVEANPETISNIRLWDHGPLANVYKQVQLIRPYYDFRDADVDRYTVNGKYRQVMLAAREVAPEKLEVDAQSWVNLKLIYTHGFGVAMSPVTEFTSEGGPEYFAKDIPDEGVITIRPEIVGDSDIEAETVVTNPRIYFGENTIDYVIVNTNTEELDYSTKEGELFRTRYSGTGGVPLSSFIRRLAYAWQLADINILISGEIIDDSRVQYRRTVQERIATVAPFLLLDRDPYIVAAEGQLFWMQDAYTTTDRFPYSDPFGVPPDQSFNYIRNSVKVTVDAFDGTLRFYMADPNDPLLLTYQSIFPDLFKPLEEMPDSLRAHIRYPQDLFRFQALKYIKYHMQDPQIFYNNEDLWAIPREKFGQSADLQPVEPYYVIMKLPQQREEEDNQAEFVLLQPYTPNTRQNIVGWLAARSDGENYGKLLVFNFPKTLTIFGPEQIEAKIDKDPDISEWFTLRCQEGSFCIRGNLLVIPVGNSLLYVEPVYLQAEGVEFPGLTKVILATADKVVMEDTVAEALKALTGAATVTAEVSTRPGAPAPGESAVSENPVQAQIDSLNDTINRVTDDLALIQEALERLRELTGGE